MALTSNNPFKVRLDWSGVDALPLWPINQFLTQVGANAESAPIPDGIYLTLGMAAPPVVLTPEDEERLRADGLLRVQTVARLVLTKERAQDLVGVLNTAIEQYVAAVDATKESAAKGLGAADG